MSKKYKAYRSDAKASLLPNFCLLGFIFIDLIALSPPLQASDVNPYLEMDLEQLQEVTIVTASKYSQKLSETASLVTVIDKQEIKQFGYRTLGDALRSVPGFFVNNNRSYENVGVRGFDQSESFNGRMLVMIDGIRINEAIYDTGFVGNELPLDIDLVERIEVVQGPGSSMYGNNAFFAVVNLITRNGQAYQGGELAGSWSSFDTYKGRFSYGRKQDNGLEYLISGTGLSSEGPRLKFPEQASDNNPRGVTKTNNTDGEQVFAKASWGDFSFEGGYGNRNVGNPGGLFGANFNDPGNNGQDSEAFVNLQYEKELTPKLDLIARAFYGDYDFTGSVSIWRLPLISSLAHAWWTGFETRLISTHFDRHTVIGGMEVQENWQQDQATIQSDLDKPIALDSRDSHRIGIYLQDDIVVTEQLKLSLGARVDDYSLTSNTLFSPRLGLIYQPFAETTLRLQYGQAFRAANVAQQFQAYDPSKSNEDDDGIETVISRGLKPIRPCSRNNIETYELSLEQMIAKYWRFTATGYYMNLDKLISAEILNDNFLQRINNNSQEGYGGNFELRRQWENGVLLRSSYSIQYAKNENDGSIQYAINNLNMGAAYPIFPIIFTS